MNFLIGNADGYDPLDPNGNIAIKWDVLQWSSSSYDVSFLFHSHFPSFSLSFSRQFWYGHFLIFLDPGLLLFENWKVGLIQGKQRCGCPHRIAGHVCAWWWPYWFVCCCLNLWTTDLHRKLSVVDPMPNPYLPHQLTWDTNGHAYMG